jgi:hypothetical protein
MGSVYAPAVATCYVLSSRTARTEIEKRIRTDSAFYIINLLGQPYSNDAIDQYRAQKYLSSPQGLEMSLSFVRNLLSFLQKNLKKFYRISQQRCSSLPSGIYCAYCFQSCYDKRSPRLEAQRTTYRNLRYIRVSLR